MGNFFSMMAKDDRQVSVFLHAILEVARAFGHFTLNVNP
jgi:hypothetical protein